LFENIIIRNQTYFFINYLVLPLLDPEFEPLPDDEPSLLLLGFVSVLLPLLVLLLLEDGSVDAGLELELLPEFDDGAE
jgi:hypothetical protein